MEVHHYCDAVSNLGFLVRGASGWISVGVSCCDAEIGGIGRIIDNDAR